VQIHEEARVREDQAIKICEQKGDRLAVVDTSHKMAFLRSFVPKVTNGKEAIESLS